mgnify:CR=1 FL=1
MTEPMTEITRGKCPSGYVPGCDCYSLADAPSEDCWQHGNPDPKQCPYCGQFRKRSEPCKRCGCDFGVVSEPEMADQSVWDRLDKLEIQNRRLIDALEKINRSANLHVLDEVFVISTDALRENEGE